MHFTGVRGLVRSGRRPGVRHEVPVERKTSGKRPAALRAGEGPLAHVPLEVRDERVLVRKGHGAEGAAERAGPRVRVHVLLQHVLARERLGAERAAERSLARVRAHVHHHIPLVRRRVGAAVAVELLAPRMERPTHRPRWTCKSERREGREKLFGTPNPFGPWCRQSIRPWEQNRNF